MLCLTLEVDNQSAQEMSGGLYNTKQVVPDSRKVLNVLDWSLVQLIWCYITLQLFDEHFVYQPQELGRREQNNGTNYQL